MADPLSPKQRARQVCIAIAWQRASTGLNQDDALEAAICAAIRDAEMAAVEAERERCCETLLNMGMHGTAEMLRAALEEDNNA